MSRGDRSAVALLMGCSALIGAAVYFASPARADGVLDATEADYATTYGSAVICPIIDYHGADGVLGALREIVADGFAMDGAVDVVNASVWAYCPRNWPLLVAIGNSARRAAA